MNIFVLDKKDFILNLINEYSDNKYKLVYTIKVNRKKNSDLSYKVHPIWVDSSIKAPLLEIKDLKVKSLSAVSKKIQEELENQKNIGNKDFNYSYYEEYFSLKPEVIKLVSKDEMIKIPDALKKIIIEKEIDLYKDLNISFDNLFGLSLQIERNEQDFYCNNKKKMDDLGISMLHMSFLSNENKWKTKSYVYTNNLVELYKFYLDRFEKNVETDSLKHYKKTNSSVYNVIVDALYQITNRIEIEKNNGVNNIWDTSWGVFTEKLLEKVWSNKTNEKLIYESVYETKNYLSVMKNSGLGNKDFFKKWCSDNKVFEKKEIENFWIKEKCQYEEILSIDKDIFYKMFPEQYRNGFSNYGSEDGGFNSTVRKIFAQVLDIALNIDLKAFGISEDEVLLKLVGKKEIELDKVYSLLNKVVEDMLSFITIDAYFSNKVEYLNRIENIINNFEKEDILNTIEKNEKRASKIKF